MSPITWIGRLFGLLSCQSSITGTGGVNLIFSGVALLVSFLIFSLLWFSFSASIQSWSLFLSCVKSDLNDSRFKSFETPFDYCTYSNILFLFSLSWSDLDDLQAATLKAEG